MAGNNPTGKNQYSNGGLLNGKFKKITALRDKFNTGLFRLTGASSRGETVGMANATQKGKTLHVAWLGASGRYSSLGVTGVRSAMRSLIAQHPTATHIAGKKAFGRLDGGKVRRVKIKR